MAAKRKTHSGGRNGGRPPKERAASPEDTNKQYEAWDYGTDETAGDWTLGD